MQLHQKGVLTQYLKWNRCGTCRGQRKEIDFGTFVSNIWILLVTICYSGLVTTVLCCVTISTYYSWQFSPSIDKWLLLRGSTRTSTSANFRRSDAQMKTWRRSWTSSRPNFRNSHANIWASHFLFASYQKLRYNRWSIPLTIASQPRK